MTSGSNGTEPGSGGVRGQDNPPVTLKLSTLLPTDLFAGARQPNDETNRVRRLEAIMASLELRADVSRADRIHHATSVLIVEMLNVTEFGFNVKTSAEARKLAAAVPGNISFAYIAKHAGRAEALWPAGVRAAFADVEHNGQLLNLIGVRWQTVASILEFDERKHAPPGASGKVSGNRPPTVLFEFEDEQRPGASSA